MSPFLARIIALVLRLSPKEFHDRFGAEVEDGMERGLRDAGQRGGAIAMLGFWSRGVGDALKTVAHERHIEGRGWFGRGSPWSDLGGDVKYALRGWRRSPGFAITVITTLALGLGLTAAIFAFADGYLFRSLPFPGSERAFRVQYLHPERAGDSRLPRSWFLALSRFDVEALRQSAVAEYGFVEWGKALQGGFTLDGDLILSDAKLPVTACSVSAGFRQTLKLPLVAGRDFTDEDHVAGAPLVAWLTEREWSRVFHRDPAVIGRSFRIEQVRRSVDVLIVGILGSDVTSFDLNDRPPDFVVPSQGARVDRTLVAFPMVLLPEGVTKEQAAERIGATLQSLAPAVDGRPRTVQLEPVLDLQVAGGRPTARVFLAGAMLVLLLAAMNLIHLLLSRCTARAGEIATRAALGASRWRVTRVFLVESLLFGACGIGAGLVVGRGLSWWIASHLPEFPTAGRNLSLIPMLFDQRTVAVAVILGLAVAVAGGLWPAFLATGGSLMRQERTDGRVRPTVSGRMARRMLISELTVASVVIIGTVFVGLGVYRYLNQPLGYQFGDRFQVFAAQPDGRPVTGKDALAAAEAVRQVSGVTAATLRHTGSIVEAVSAPSSTADTSEVFTLSVNSDYFKAWEIELRAGRTFIASEHPDNGTVAMVSAPLAQRLWPGVNAIGKTIRAAGSLREVVGVIEGLRWQLDIEPEASVYVPAGAGSGSTFVLAHFPRGTLESVGPLLAAAVQHAVPSATVTVKAVTYASMLERGAGEARFQGPVVMIFGVLAITLAGIGVFGLVSYLVEQRTREFGIRMAMGAQLQDIWRTVMRESLQPTVIGLTVGSAGALALESVVQASVFGWKSSGPTAIAIVAVGLLFVAVIAALIPAGRAARVDPATTLRAE